MLEMRVESQSRTNSPRCAARFGVSGVRLARSNNFYWRGLGDDLPWTITRTSRLRGEVSPLMIRSACTRGVRVTVTHRVGRSSIIPSQRRTTSHRCAEATRRRRRFASLKRTGSIPRCPCNRRMFASFKWENWTSLFYFIEQILPALASGKTVGCNLTWRRITSPSSRTVAAEIFFHEGLPPPPEERR